MIKHWKTLPVSSKLWLGVLTLAIIIVSVSKITPLFINIFIPKNILVYSHHNDVKVHAIQSKLHSLYNLHTTSLMFKKNEKVLGSLSDISVKVLEYFPPKVEIYAHVLGGSVQCKISFDSIAASTIRDGHCDISQLDLSQDPTAYSLGVQGTLSGTLNNITSSSLELDAILKDAGIEAKKFFSALPNIDSAEVKSRATLSNSSISVHSMNMTTEYGNIELQAQVNDIRSQIIQGSGKFSLNELGEEKILPWIAMTSRGKKVDPESSFTFKGPVSRLQVTYK